MANSIFGIATGALSAAQAGLATTSHNIANVNTPAYSRQQTVQETAIPRFTGAGFFGAGVQVATIQRVYSDFLAVQARDTRSQASAAETLSTQLASLDNLLSDDAAGLAPALADFFAGVQGVAANPNDPAARQALLSRADSLAARFHSIDDRLEGMRRDANMRARGAVDEINSYASQIALLNRRIGEASAQASQGQPPNDLLDQRDGLLTDLNKVIGATAVAQSDGSINVFIGNGQAIVNGEIAQPLVAFADPESPQDTAIGMRVGASQLQFRPAELSGGSLGGLLAFRETDLPAARNALGRIAESLAADFNAQHELGQDRNGALGGAFFNAGAPQALARSANAGNGQLSVAVSSYQALTTSSYRVSYDGANYNVLRLADGVTRSFAALPQTVDGLDIALASGAPAAGDSWRLEPTLSGAAGFAVLVRDVNAIAAAAPIRTSTAPANTGRGAISAGAVNAPPPPNANLQQTVTITFTSAGTFDVSGTGTGNPAGVAYVPGMTVTYNGWSATLDGAPATGDRFTVSANSGGVSDNRNAQRLAALQTQRGLEGGTASYSSANSELVSLIGNRAREAQIASSAQAQLADTASAGQQALSGVNLDEEAANLLRYQQAYQAAGKALQIADSLFSTLLDLGK